MSAFDLVVVGVSLGGVDALTTLLRGLPHDFALPLSIVQHRGHRGKDGLERVLADASSLAVVEVEDKMAALAGAVYLAPQNYHLLVERGRNADDPRIYFSLSVDAPASFARPSIDALFESAAVACRTRVIGVVLTGANSDGTAGLLAIYEAGGTAIVEDPQTAFCSVMPGSALRAVPTSQVCNLKNLASLLMRLSSPPIITEA